MVGSHRAPSKRRASKQSRLRLAFGAGMAGLVVHGLMLWTGTSAAFTASTSNPTNAWNAASVAISDDDAGTAMFTATGLTPGSTGSKCITVTYNGNVAAGVKLYVSASSGTLGPHLNMTVEEGTGGSFSDCTGFTIVGSAIYTGTLSNFAATSTAYSSGVGTWAPSTSGTTRTYKFTYTLDSATPSSMQSTTAGADFSWEAQA